MGKKYLRHLNPKPGIANVDIDLTNPASEFCHSRTILSTMYPRMMFHTLVSLDKELAGFYRIQNELRLKSICGYFKPGVSKLLLSLGHTGRRRVVLSHTLNTQTQMTTNEQKRVHE